MSNLIDLETGTVLLVDKPITWTSFDVTNKIKRLIQRSLNTQADGNIAVKRKVKVGHAGTLDPLATGLLIICAGRETKNIDKYMGMPKTYTGSFFLGATTPSFDKETAHNATFSISHITDAMIYHAALQLTGEQEQIPPIYSAIKKDGKRAYMAARAGEELVLDARKITIYSFEITAIVMPLVYFKIVCSKGTYIRSLARDFGALLESGAYLNSLCRTQIGEFELKDARSLEEIASELGETMEKRSSL